MPGESTYSSIAALIGNIYEIALQAAREGNVVAPLVTTFGDRNSSEPRVFANYSGGTFASTSETDDLSSQAFTAVAAGTLSPAVYAQQVFLTNRRIRTDQMNAQRDAGEFLGASAAEQIDSHLVGLFSSFSGGTVGAGGSVMTWQYVFRAAAYLRANKVPLPYSVVVRPEHWYSLTSASSGVPQLMIVDSIAQSVAGRSYTGSLGGLNFFVDANIAAGTASTAGVFGRQAIALDMRQPFTIQPQYDASRSGNGGWELNASMEYAYGIFRAAFGARIIATTNV